MPHDNKKPIGIIGNGAIGSALGKLLQDAGSIVYFWDAEKSKCTISSLGELDEQCEIIILATPSWTNKQIASELKSNHQKIVLSLAKGVEEGFITMDEVLRKAASANKFDYGVLYGPMLAEELNAGKPSIAVMAVSDKKWYGAFDLSVSQRFKVQYSLDVHGVAVCGVLKNIYAVAFGINDGLELGMNAKGALAVRIFSEMKEVLRELNVDPQLGDGIAGVGDLLATGWSELSFNHRIGKAIAERIAPEDTKGEGVVALGEISSVLEIENFPVLNMLKSIVISRHDPMLLETLIG